MSPSAEVSQTTPSQELELNGHGKMENGQAGKSQKFDQDEHDESGILTPSETDASQSPTVTQERATDAAEDSLKGDGLERPVKNGGHKKGQQPGSNGEGLGIVVQLSPGDAEKNGHAHVWEGSKVKAALAELAEDAS